MTKISKIKKSIENQENKIKNCIEFLEPSKKKEKTIKAYIVSDLWNEHSCIVLQKQAARQKAKRYMMMFLLGMILHLSN